MDHPGDTIYALSTGSLPSGVAVIRLSGAESIHVIERLCGTVPEPRVAALRKVKGLDGAVIDEGLALVFKGPASFTGEDCAELQVHGGRAVVQAVLEAIGSLPGLRQATAGEFTRRAFENGKLDLVEVEGLGELIHAETELQRRFARYLADGHLSAVYQRWMDRLSQGRALIEAELDFYDEDDIPGKVSDVVWGDLAALHAEMIGSLSDRTAEIVRDGYKVAIAGPPNAGKSTLLNALAKRDIAIVTDIAGTTRDVLSVDIDLDGMKVQIFDTAGLRETDDAVEKIGIARARDVIAKADLLLYLSAEAVVEAELPTDGTSRENILVVRTKAEKNFGSAMGHDLEISALENFGLDSLVKHISDRAAASVANGHFTTPLLSRHRNKIENAILALSVALADTDKSLELRAEDLRVAAQCLGEITGHVSADALLGMVFSQFCVGK